MTRGPMAHFCLHLAPQCRQLGDLSHPEIFKFQDVIKIKKINKQFSHSFKKKFPTFIFLYREFSIKKYMIVF